MTFISMKYVINNGDHVFLNTKTGDRKLAKRDFLYFVNLISPNKISHSKVANASIYPYKYVRIQTSQSSLNVN